MPRSFSVRSTRVWCADDTPAMGATSSVSSVTDEAGKRCATAMDGTAPHQAAADVSWQSENIQENIH